MGLDIINPIMLKIHNRIALHGKFATFKNIESLLGVKMSHAFTALPDTINLTVARLVSLIAYNGKELVSY